MLFIAIYVTERQGLNISIYEMVGGHSMSLSLEWEFWLVALMVVSYIGQSCWSVMSDSYIYVGQLY